MLVFISLSLRKEWRQVCPYGIIEEIISRGCGTVITCTFAGHRDVFQSNIPEKLDAAISQIIETHDDAFIFLVGNDGQFDGMCSSAVRRAKRKYKNKKISLHLVLPYFSQELNEQQDYYKSSFDDVVIPMKLAGVHYKSAITKRNRWMVDESAYLIAYVCRDFGGAYTTLHYAEKQKKQIINLAEETHCKAIPHAKEVEYEEAHKAKSDENI